MKEQLEKIRELAGAELESIASRQELEALRIKFLGKKGELTAILKQMGALSQEERPRMGQLANEAREFIEGKIEECAAALLLKEQEAQLKAEVIDVTVPGTPAHIGHKHPLSTVLDEVKDIFLGMGFKIATGPEVEWDYYNFEALNIPENHPARDTQDSFYISE